MRRYALLFVKLFVINMACVGAIALGCMLLIQRADMDVAAVVGAIAASIAIVGVIGAWHEDRALSTG